jgi:hypothetical protein
MAASGLQLIVRWRRIIRFIGRAIAGEQLGLHYVATGTKPRAVRRLARGFVPRLAFV